jgi:hypothetical protein
MLGMMLVLSVTALAATRSSTSYQQVVNQQNTAVFISTSPAPAISSSPVTVTAQVTGAKAGTDAPIGTLDFVITDAAQNTQSQSVPLSNGLASITVTLLPGTYSIVATYGGSQNFASNSASTTLTVAPATTPGAPDFAFNLSTSTGSIPQGSSLLSTATVTGINGFAGPVSLSCGTLPAQMNCAFSPVSVTVDAKGAQSTLTVATVGTTVQTASLSFILCGLIAIPFQRRLKPRLKKCFLQAGPLIAICMLCACGNGTRYVQSNGTPPGTYKIAVTATAGAISHTNTVTVTVH